jgi:DeoR/GlpR family transcriptional regulator of sugar metabolism
MIKCAHKTVSLAIAEKLNTIQRLQVCRPEDIHMLITELEPEDPRSYAYREKGIPVL